MLRPSVAEILEDAQKFPGPHYMRRIKSVSASAV